MSSWFNTIGTGDGWFSSMFSGVTTSASGTVAPSISSMIMDVFEGGSGQPPELELIEFPTLPKAVDRPEFMGITEKYVPPTIHDVGLEDLDIPGGIIPPKADVLHPLDAMDTAQTSRLLRNSLRK